MLGICVGYGVYYLDVVYPEQNNGRRLLQAPDFIKSQFPDVNVQGMQGAVPTQQQRPAGRSLWGTGHRLGTD
jgi:hypothetical protein